MGEIWPANVAHTLTQTGDATSLIEHMVETGLADLAGVPAQICNATSTSRREGIVRVADTAHVFGSVLPKLRKMTLEFNKSFLSAKIAFLSTNLARKRLKSAKKGSEGSREP